MSSGGLKLDNELMKNVRMVGLLIFEFTRSFTTNRKGKIIKKMNGVSNNVRDNFSSQVQKKTCIHTEINIGRRSQMIRRILFYELSIVK